MAVCLCRCCLCVGLALECRSGERSEYEKNQINAYRSHLDLRCRQCKQARDTRLAISRRALSVGDSSSMILETSKHQIIKLGRSTGKYKEILGGVPTKAKSRLTHLEELRLWGKVALIFSCIRSTLLYLTLYTFTMYKYGYYL